MLRKRAKRCFRNIGSMQSYVQCTLNIFREAKFLGGFLFGKDKFTIEKLHPARETEGGEAGHRRELATEEAERIANP